MVLYQENGHDCTEANVCRSASNKTLFIKPAASQIWSTVYSRGPVGLTRRSAVFPITSPSWALNSVLFSSPLDSSMIPRIRG